jgi:ATP-binding cassette subfamily C (CFTR/MRP) protein 1
MVFFTLISIMTLLSTFCDKEPKHSTFPKHENPSPELSAGSLNQLFYWWFNSTTWKGFRNPLTVADVYNINPQFKTAEVAPKFDKNFQASVEKNSNSSSDAPKADESVESLVVTSGSVLSALWNSFNGLFLFALFLRIIADLLQFAQPFLLGALIEYVANDGALWKGLILTFTFFGISFLLAILNNYQVFVAFQVSFKVRASLISAIYRKALKISSTAKRDTTIGEIVNLMAVDAHRFFETIVYLFYGLTTPLIMGLALYFLWLVIGVSAFAGLAVLILMFPISGVIANEMQKVQSKQMTVKDERVKSITEILAGIKVIKFYAWEKSFQEQIAETRQKELHHLRSAALLNSCTEFIWTLAPFLVSFATFTTYVLLGNSLTPDVAFVSIVLFNILRLPITLRKHFGIIILILQFSPFYFSANDN